MKVYLDIIFIINFIFDFIILLSTSIILKKNIKFYRIILGSLFGSITLVILFIRLNNIELIIYKLLVSIFMIIITFGYKYLLKNIYYFYLVSIIIGGLIYFINNQFSSNNGLLFFNSYKYNILLGIILSIIGINIYIKSLKNYKVNYSKYYKVILYFKNKELKINAFLDTGNKLKDPYLFRPIILVNKKLLDTEGNIIVPYKGINNGGLLRCIKIDKIYIDGLGYRNNFLVGLSDSINIDGIDCILNERLLEG